MAIRFNVVGFASAVSITSAAIVSLSANSSFGADSPKAPTAFSREQIEFYEKEIHPLLSENCFKCHSHTADKIKGNFVLDSREGLLRGGDSGAAIVPGDPEKSLLIKAVRQVDEDLKMPPKKK